MTAVGRIGVAELGLYCERLSPYSHRNRRDQISLLHVKSTSDQFDLFETAEYDNDQTIRTQLGHGSNRAKGFSV